MEVIAQRRLQALAHGVEIEAARLGHPLEGDPAQHGLERRPGPNKSDAVRKSYIVQLAPDGAHVCPAEGPPVLQSDPARQFEILRDGQPVTPTD